jgi:hypothetical protein
VGDSMLSQKVGLLGTGNCVRVFQKVHPLGRVDCSPKYCGIVSGTQLYNIRGIGSL